MTIFREEEWKDADANLERQGEIKEEGSLYKESNNNDDSNDYSEEEHKTKKIILREFPYPLLQPNCRLNSILSGRKFYNKFCTQANLRLLFMNLSTPRPYSKYVLIGLKEDKNAVKVNTKILVERFLRDLFSIKANHNWLGFFYDSTVIEVFKIRMYVKKKRPLGKKVHWFLLKSEDHPLKLDYFCRVNPLYVQIPLADYDIDSIKKSNIDIKDDKYIINYKFFVKNIVVSYSSYQKEDI